MSAPTTDPVGDPTAHGLLLALAGRLDDDLVAWARELVAVGEEGQAVELATAALAAERVALPSAVRAAVVAAGRAVQTDLDVDRELADAVPDDVTEHRFDAAAAPGDRVAAVLAALPARRLVGCTFHLTWRLTPAGTAPGPVPRAVLLVEAGPDRSAEVLAYLLATELARAGVPTSVEVFTTGAALPAYHLVALRAARRIEVGATVIAPAGVVVARTVAEVAARTPGGPDVDAGTRADTAALFVVPSPHEGSADSRRVGGRRRRREPAGTAVEEFPASPGPADPGSGAASLESGPPVDADPADDPLAGPVDAEPTGVAPSAADPGPEDAPDTDPFHGPLRVPLLAPLLDPTAPGSDETSGVGVPEPTPIRPLPAQPATDDPDGPADRPAHPVESDTARTEHVGLRPAPAVERPSSGPLSPMDSESAVPAASGPDADDQPSGMTRPVAPGAAADPDAADGDEVPQEWEDDWRTGEWAMPPARLPRPPAEEAPPPEAFDVFETSAARAADGNAAEPSDVEKTGRTAVRRDGPAADLGPGPRRSPHAEPPPSDASLFDSPTARVTRPSRPAGPAQAGELPRRLPPLPDPPPAGPDEVPLFSDAPPGDGRSPEAAPSDLPRAGRRRRPDPEEPKAAASPSVDAESPPLNSTERDLLAQLQADLASQERRPRPYRRARTGVTPAANGHDVNGHGVNGHGGEGRGVDGRGTNGHDPGPPGGRTPPDAAG